MKAIVRHTYGSPEVIELCELQRPTPRVDEVLIRVRASSVNFADHAMMTGTPFPVRFLTGLFKPKPNRALGIDVAGIVEAVGANVTTLRIGDEVYGEIENAYAEYACAKESLVVKKPANLSFELAAAVPVAGLTALQGLRGVTAGQKVLINGASGGVGTFAVQIAKAQGAEVTGVCSGRNAELVRSLGADHVVDYTREDFTQTQQRYDVIFDLAGSAPLLACRRITKRYISSVGRTSWLLKSLFALVLGRVSILAAGPCAKDLHTLRDMIEAGRIHPVIDRRFTLSETREALRYQGQGRTRGKSVIAI